MIIKNIEVKGSGKPVAALEFQRGLNVVAGASDTGKSYVVECIQFILGASDVPKSIDESAGYDYLEVTFQEDDGSQFRLQRKLAPKADTLLMQDGSDEVIVLKGKHRKGFDNLSNWFLARLKLNDKLLLKSKENLTTQALTLRTLENIFVIDEARIVAKYSPLGKGQLIDRTLEMSFLKTLLTGEDDSDAKELKVNKESKAAIAKKMVSLEELIEKLYPVQDGGEQEIGKIDEEIEQLEEQLEKADAALSDIVGLNQTLLNNRHGLISEITQLDESRREGGVLIDRFELLRAKYESDRARLLGIWEAADVLDSYTTVACPTCGQAFQNETSDEDIDLTVESANAEAQKIDAQLVGLNKAIADLRTSIAQTDDELLKRKRTLDEISSTLNGNLRGKIDETNQIKLKLYSRKSELAKVRLTLETRNKALAELGLLKTQAGVKQAAYDTEIRLIKNWQILRRKLIWLWIDGVIPTIRRSSFRSRLVTSLLQENQEGTSGKGIERCRFRRLQLA
jgi:AAA domain